MDGERAKRIARELKGKSVDGWPVERLLGYGKSAVVLQTSNGKNKAAIKLFDPEIVAKFGYRRQLRRIAREKELVGVVHPNLVKIIGGGRCKTTKYLYIVMELVRAKNLEQRLQEVPRESIPRIISQVARGAEYLFNTCGKVHRDIKPSNIAVTREFGKAILLDFGVVKPFECDDLTELSSMNMKPFIGTLRYASPEFMYGEVDEDNRGWEAVTFYQLGGVLHDMIMKKPLFYEFSEPFPRLVRAIDQEHPLVDADDVDSRWIELANHCLEKDARKRLQLVSWEDFAIKRPAIGSSIPREELRSSIRKMQQAAYREDASTTKLTPSALREVLAKSIRRRTRDALIAEQGLPPLITTQLSLREGTIYMFCLQFAPSADCGLDQWVNFGVACDLSEEGKCRVTVTDLVSDKQCGPAELEGRTEASIWDDGAIAVDVAGHILDRVATRLTEVLNRNSGVSRESTSE